jgi:hypothetical protein
MKILYKNLPFKTNRNVLAKMNAGINAPNNLNNQLQKVKISTLELPNEVYHMSLSPISSFRPNRIFYVSFDKHQAFYHVSQYIENIQRNKYKNGKEIDTRIYVYTLKPKKQNIQAIVFNESYRPKNISNGIGLKYNTFSRKALGKMSMGGGAVNKNNINSANFEEGSGDNMILGHLLCSKTKINGIRNTNNQDELAICNPINFFTVTKREILDVGVYPYPNGPLPPGRIPQNRIFNLKYIKFNNNNRMYKVTKGRGNLLESLLHKYGIKNNNPNQIN